MAASWDPSSLPTVDAGAARSIDPQVMRRLRNELRELLGHPLSGIVVVPDEESVLKLHALITGPSAVGHGRAWASGSRWAIDDQQPRLDGLITTRAHAGPEGTPYACGFFVFTLGVSNDYPSSPPRVKLLTTGGGQVRDAVAQRQGFDEAVMCVHWRRCWRRAV
jgi:hypothetical protein